MTLRFGPLLPRLARRRHRRESGRIARAATARHYSRSGRHRLAPIFATAALGCGMALATVAAGGILPPPLDGALVPGERVRIVETIDGDTVRLADGSEVRLVGLQAPKLALGRPGFVDWPLADAAKAALARLADGEAAQLAFGGRRIDRHCRHLAHLLLDDGTPGGAWSQAALLEQGMARVYSFADNRALVAEMLGIERDARDAGRGIWADPWYAVRDVDEVADDVDSYQLVEGRVLAAERVKGRGYLNFGADWKTDFTLTLDREALRLFDEAGIDFEALAGHRIRARGWVEYFNGPMIEITHPEQIEDLEP